MLKLFSLFLAAIIISTSLFAAGDVTIRFNSPDNVVFRDALNYMEIWIQNDQIVEGMAIGFEFTSTAGTFSWLPYGNEPSSAVNRYMWIEPLYSSCWNLGEWSALTNQLPSRFLTGGAAIPPAGLAVHNNSTKIITMFLDGNDLDDTSGVFCVDNVFIPPAGTWTFDQGAGGFAPTFNGNPNTSQTVPDAPPICFPVRNLVKGDSDGSGFVSISDVVHLINYIFGGGSAPSPMRAGDADCNRIISISDAVYIRNYIFGGPAPC